MTANISPYVVYRRCRLPLAELAGQRFDLTWATIDELDALLSQADACAAELSEVLGAWVPLADEPVRAELVRLRRDIYNQRADRAAPRITALEPHLEASTRAALKTWRELAERAAELTERAESLLEQEKGAARAGFRRLFEHDAMAKSIQLSGHQLYQSLHGYVTGTHTSVKPSKLRTLESSLVNFAYRAAMKPSPFGRFTEVGAFPPGAAGTGTGDSAPRSDSVLNRFLLTWLVGRLARDPDGLDLGLLLLNSSVEVEASAIRFVGIKAGGHVGAEAVVRIKRDRTVDRVLELLAGGAAPVPAVLAGLTELTGDEAAGRKLVQALIRAGLLAFRFGVDEQEPEYSRKLAEFIGVGTGGLVPLLAREFDVLRKLETEFPVASVTERGALMSGAEQAVANIAEACGVGAPPEVIVRAPLYEDVWTRALPASWSQETARANLPALDSMRRFASLLDSGQVKRIGLYAFAAEQFGDRETVPFLEFFDRFTQLPEPEQAAVFAGRDSAIATAFTRQRTEAMHAIDAGMVERDGGLHLDPGVVNDACAGVRDRLDAESVTFRVQFAGDDPTLVVNGVLTGYGVYFSRFSRFIEESGVDGWTLRSALRAHLRDVFPGQVDVNAVLGFNFNLHPPLTDRVLDYPGSWPMDADQRRYGLGALQLRIDHARRRLVLWDPDADEPLDVMPMNFLIPVGAPRLYQVLDALSPTTWYSWQPLRDIRYEPDPTVYPGSSPRLTVGDMVVDRQSWTVQAKDIPMVAELSKDSYPALRGFDRWRREQGLPRHAFVVCQTLDEYNVLSGRSSRLSWDWSEFTHLHKASVHKPMYVDFRNPYLVRSFAKSALSRPGVHVSIRECLPAVGEYDGGAGPAAAEEFFVELNNNAR